MKLESIIGVVLGALLIAGAVVYFVSPKSAPSGRVDIPSVVVQDQTPVATATSSQTDVKSTTQTAAQKPVAKSNLTFLTATQKKAKLSQAPEITNPSGFVNTDGKPITIAQFKGKKAVLIDIWTYSCINCQRTLPYVKAWYDKYHDQGLEIISIHTPEFSFEKVQKNVEEAAQRDSIKYPIVLDNNYGTWNAFGNQYWPRKYLIDIDGYVIYDHAGEGAYDETEKAIQYALEERSQRLNTQVNISGATVKPKDMVTVDAQKVASPEMYFGSKRSDPSNDVTFTGDWKTDLEYKQNNAAAKIIYKYNAKNVYMVASDAQGQTVQILRDGKPFKSVLIKDEMLYTLIEGTDYGEHTIEIDIPNPGLKAFTFTFG